MEAQLINNLFTGYAAIIATVALVLSFVRIYYLRNQQIVKLALGFTPNYQTRQAGSAKLLKDLLFRITNTGLVGASAKYIVLNFSIPGQKKIEAVYKEVSNNVYFDLEAGKTIEVRYTFPNTHYQYRLKSVYAEDAINNKFWLNSKSIKRINKLMVEEAKARNLG